MIALSRPHHRARLLITHVSMRFGGVETQLLTLLRGRDPRACAPHICLSCHSHTNPATHLGTRLAGRRTPTSGSFAGVVDHGRLDRIRAQVLWRMTGLWCVGQGVAASLASCYGEMPHVFVIPNCIDIEMVARNAREPVNHPWLGAHSSPVLITVARLVPAKGADSLLHSFARLVAATPARLLIIGDGPKRVRLEGLAQRLQVTDGVELLGYQANPHRSVSRCDAFVFGSTAGEGLPTVLLEPMVCRIPIITTAYPGVEDAVSGGLTGVVVPIRDQRTLLNGQSWEGIQ